MNIIVSTLLFTFVTLLFFNQSSASPTFIQVEMEDGSLFYGIFDPISTTPPWVITKPEVYTEYGVFIVRGEGQPIMAHEHLVHVNIAPKKTLRINPRQPPRLRPKIVQLPLGTKYYTATNFQFFEGQIPDLRLGCRIYITMKGTDNILIAWLRKAPHTLENIEKAIWDRWMEHDYKSQQTIPNRRY